MLAVTPITTVRSVRNAVAKMFFDPMIGFSATDAIFWQTLKVRLTGLQFEGEVYLCALFYCLVIQAATETGLVALPRKFILTHRYRYLDYDNRTAGIIPSSCRSFQDSSRVRPT